MRKVILAFGIVAIAVAAVAATAAAATPVSVSMTLTEPLRSHGGLTEQVVPMIVNRQVTWPKEQLRNFDVFDVALNRVAA